MVRRVDSPIISQTQFEIGRIPIRQTLVCPSWAGATARPGARAVTGQTQFELGLWSKTPAPEEHQFDERQFAQFAAQASSMDQGSGMLTLRNPILRVNAGGPADPGEGRPLLVQRICCGLPKPPGPCGAGHWPQRSWSLAKPDRRQVRVELGSRRQHRRRQSRPAVR